MKIKKIIIFDDDIENTSETENLLAQNNFEIIKENNTDDILNFVKTIKPDLIILDLKINGLTGIYVIKLLKKDIQTKDLPIMMLINYYYSNDGDYTKNKFGVNILLKESIKSKSLINEIKKIEKKY